MWHPVYALTKYNSNKNSQISGGIFSCPLTLSYIEIFLHGNGLISSGPWYITCGWRVHPMGMAYTSNRGSVYIQSGWRIHPIGVTYTSNENGAYI